MSNKQVLYKKNNNGIKKCFIFRSHRLMRDVTRFYVIILLLFYSINLFYITNFMVDEKGVSRSTIISSGINYTFIINILRRLLSWTKHLLTVLIIFWLNIYECVISFALSSLRRNMMIPYDKQQQILSHTRSGFPLFYPCEITYPYQPMERLKKRTVAR